MFRECESICFLIKFGICPLLWSYVKNLIAFSLSPEPRLVQPKQIYSCTQQLARPCRVGAMKMQRQITSVMSSHMCLRMQRCDEHKVFACCILASKAAKLNWSWSLKDLNFWTKIKRFCACIIQINLNFKRVCEEREDGLEEQLVSRAIGTRPTTVIV